jgi:hypothetical protein
MYTTKTHVSHPSTLLGEIEILNFKNFKNLEIKLNKIK